MNNEFDGVFKFTNTSKEDFTVLWNNKEYTFPAESTCPMIIPNESLENIQEIRKRFALKWAQREWLKSKTYKGLEKEAGKFLVPATYNDKLLEPYIEQCLNPLPLASAKVIDVPKKEVKFRDGGTAILGDGANVARLSSADGEFKDYVPPIMGQMS